MKPFLTTCLILIVSFYSNAQNCDCISDKKIDRVNPNLINAANSDFANTTGHSWFNYSGKCYTSGGTALWSSSNGYDGTQGCMKLVGPRPNTSGCATGNFEWDDMRLRDIPIEGEKKYTVSFYMKSDEQCYSPKVYLYLS